MDYYEVLEVMPAASDEVIRMAYKALAKKYHPDIHVGDKEYALKKMSEINQAYEILSDSKKRAEYDITRDSARANSSYKDYGEQNTDRAAYTDTPHSTEQQNQPKQSQRANKRAPSITYGLWGTVKAIIIVILIYGVFSGKLNSFVKNIMKTSDNNAQQQIEMAKNDERVDARQKEIHGVVGDYLVCLQKNDGEGALACVQGQRLYDVTDAIIQVYTGFDTPEGFGYEMMKKARQFTYTLENAVFSADYTGAAVDVKIEVANLYAVVTIAQTNASEKLADEDWVNQYVLETALSGDTNASELDVLNDSIKEAIKLDIRKLQFDMRFNLVNVDGRWVISEITDDSDFANAVTGNTISLVGELLSITQ